MLAVQGNFRGEGAVLPLYLLLMNPLPTRAVLHMVNHQFKFRFKIVAESLQSQERNADPSSHPSGETEEI